MSNNNSEDNMNDQMININDPPSDKNEIVEKESFELRPAKDVELSDIPQGKARYRVIATVVSINQSEVIFNDKKYQIVLALDYFEGSEPEMGQLGRLIASINRENDTFSGYLIAFHPLTKEQLKQYNRIVKLESRQLK